MLGFAPLADNSIAGFDTLNIAVTGIAATGAVGTIGIISNVAVTGVAGTAAVGTVSVNAEISVTGLAATGLVGSVFLWDQIIPSQNSQFSGITVSQTPSWTNIAA
tara:strand:+ start:1037 stop:1351 length:315 start_codon:yes stop_codon:yes gene_type:complete